MVETGVKLRKVVIFTVKGCYRSVCNHIVLVGMLCLLMLLYRSFPFLFSLLVSASPVLVCTAALLGTLLSFGQPNIPEIEKEERTTHVVVPLKTGFSRDAVIVERNESCSVERYSEIGRDVVEKANEETNLVQDGIGEVGFGGSGEQMEGRSAEMGFDGKVGEDMQRVLQGFEYDNEETNSAENGFGNVGSDGSLAGDGLQMEERSREMQFNGRVEEGTERGLQGFEHELNNEMLKVGVGDRRTARHQYSLIPEDDDETLDAEVDR